MEGALSPIPTPWEKAPVSTVSNRSYGTVSENKQKEASGLAFVQGLANGTGTIKAEGVVLSRGQRVGTAEKRITDRNGRLLAHGTTTCLIFEN
jgi:hypothetical protein